MSYRQQYSFGKKNVANFLQNRSVQSGYMVTLNGIYLTEKKAVEAAGVLS
jgi:hypothetical protein